MSVLAEFVLGSADRCVLPIASYPGTALTGATVRDVVTDPAAQTAAAVALHQRYSTRVVQSAMDLSAEAEAFGAAVAMGDAEVPAVRAPIVHNRAEVDALAVPEPGASRTGVFLETVRRLNQLTGRPLVLGGCIGPFTLAARLAGMTEACRDTLTDPPLVHALVAKCVRFLIPYVRAFRDAGADAVLMAEPAAGLLSPRGLATFSSAYVRQIVAAVDDGRFTLMLHNCGALLTHLPAVLESGVKIFHFGAPMDVPAALAQVGPEIIVCGNLDPTAVFVQSTAEQVTARATALLDTTRGHRHFVLSSGCDLPAAVPLANLDAFYAAVHSFPPLDSKGPTECIR